MISMPLRITHNEYNLYKKGILNSSLKVKSTLVSTLVQFYQSSPVFNITEYALQYIE